MNKRLHEKAHEYVKKAIDEILTESLPSIVGPTKPTLPKLEIDEMVKSEATSSSTSAIPEVSLKF